MATLSVVKAADLGPQHLFLCVEVTAATDALSTAAELLQGVPRADGDVVAGQLSGYTRRGDTVDLRLGMHQPTLVRIRADSKVCLVDAPVDQRPVVGWGS